MIAEDRRQMSQFLGERMTRSYSQLSKRQQLEADTSLVKTYLIEAHETEQPQSLVRQTFGARSKAELAPVRIHESNEQTLVTLETHSGNEAVFAYIDFTDPRFWLIHSMASSGTIDHLVDRAVTRSSELDKAWLPSRFLEYVSHLGSFRGLGLDYDRRAFAETDLDSDDAPVAFLKMQLWGNKAAEVLEVLRGADAFPSETTLSKVKVKFWLTNADELFTLDDVKFDGKITARGTSFESHLDLTNQLYAVYAHSIKHIETEYSLATEHTGDSISLRGEPIHFSFSRPIQNLSAFCKSLCTAGPPFRLWGAPVSVTAALYRIHAVDLHVGSRVTLEVTNEFMRVYLPEDSCGNTVLRLLTNLQHHYDALVRATSADGEDILGLQLTHAQPLDRPL